jgi:hypothetical protein
MKMKLFDAMRSKASGQTQEQFGAGERFPMTKSISRAVVEHMNELSRTDMSKYTFERRHSDYPDSKSDLVIYNNDGAAVFTGRETRDGRMSFWRPS